MEPCKLLGQSAMPPPNTEVNIITKLLQKQNRNHQESNIKPDMDGNDCSVATVHQTEEPALSCGFACYTVGSNTWFSSRMVAPSPICTTTSSSHTRA